MRASFRSSVIGFLILSGCEAQQASLTPQNSFLDQSELVKPRINFEAGKDDSTRAPTPPAASNVAAVAKAAPADTVEHTDRTIIYSASLNLTVTDLNQTLDAIRSSATSLGGYLQEQNASTITVRVPANRFDQLLSNVEKMGEVIQKQLHAQDVTEEMRDLTIRLDNAEQIRQRLLKLLDKADRMEDTLKVEVELERVTQTVELLKGKIKFLQTQAALSTLTVVLNSPVPQNQQIARIPFPWILELGSGLVSGNVSTEAARGGWFSHGIGFDLPKTYVKYFQTAGVTEAMSAEGMLIKVQEHDNLDKAKVQFWSALARRSLVESRSVAITHEDDLKLKTGLTAHILIGSKELGGKRDGYMLAIASNDSHVITFEAWGPADQFEADHAVLNAAIQSLDFGQ